MGPRCRGRSARTGQPCEVAPGAVRSNGYCDTHQAQRDGDVQLVLAEVEMPAPAAEAWQRAIAAYQHAMAAGQTGQPELEELIVQCHQWGGKRQCRVEKKTKNSKKHNSKTKNSKKQSHRKAAGGYVEPPAEAPMPAAPALQAWAANGGPALGQAQANSLTYESALRTKQQVDERLRGLDQQMTQRTAEYTQSMRQQEATIEQLRQQMAEAQVRQQAAEAQRQTLQQQVDLGEAKRLQLSGADAATLSVAQAEADHFRQQYETMLAREKTVSASLDQLVTGQAKLAESVKKLDAERKQLAQEALERAARIQQLEMQQTPEQAQRDEELNSLRHDLKEAKKSRDELKRISDELLGKGKDLMVMHQNSQAPQDSLAQELQTAAHDIEEKTKIIGTLEKELGEARDRLARSNVDNAAYVQRNTSAMRSQMTDLQRELHQSTERLSRKQLELSQAHEKMARLQHQLQTETRQLEERLHRGLLQYKRLKQQRDSEHQEFLKQVAEHKNAFRTREAEMQARELQHRQELQEQLKAQMNRYKAEFLRRRDEVETERRRLALRQRQTQELGAIQTKKEQEVARLRRELQSRQIELQAREESVKQTLTRAATQAHQMGELQRSFDHRIKMQQHAMQVERDRYRKEMTQLKADERAWQKTREETQRQLLGCEAARDKLTMRNRDLEETNARLQGDAEALKQNLEQMRAKYEAHLDQIRGEQTQLEANQAAYQTQLREASLVHDHVKQLMEQCQATRTANETALKAAQDQLEALKRASQDRALGQAQVERLQDALRAALREKENGDARVKAVNAQMHTLKTMAEQSQRHARELAEKHAAGLREVQVKMEHERLSHKSREHDLEEQLNRLRLQRNEMERALRRDQQQNELLRNSLADTELSAADRVRRLMTAHNVDPLGLEPGATGESTLVAT